MASTSDQSQNQTPSIPRYTLYRRPVNASKARHPASGPLIPDVDPPPKAPAIFQLIAFGLLVFFACFQFLPATHVRDPNDPHRNWIPIDSNRAANSNEEIQRIHDEEIQRIHVYSWTDCLDLRAIAVLVNSTLSSSRFPEHIYFHFLVPEDEDEKLPYYKLKVLLPHSNLDIIGQKEVKEKLRTGIPELEPLWPSLHQLIPLVIPIINPSLSRFIYISSNTMMKGNIEELFGVDLGTYAIAATNDCSRRLGNYVNIDMVNAIQRTGAKTWVSDEPYNGDDCTPDFNLLLFNARKLDKKLMEGILWWRKVLNLKDERNNKTTAAIVLALHDKYLELPSIWNLHNSISTELHNESKILPYDGPAQVCSEDMRQHKGLDTGNMWRQYLNPKSDSILEH